MNNIEAFVDNFVIKFQYKMIKLKVCDRFNMVGSCKAPITIEEDSIKTMKRCRSSKAYMEI